MQRKAELLSADNPQRTIKRGATAQVLNPQFSGD
jgi:hypothetical protein